MSFTSKCYNPHVDLVADVLSPVKKLAMSCVHCSLLYDCIKCDFFFSSYVELRLKSFPASLKGEWINNIFHSQVKYQPGL